MKSRVLLVAACFLYPLLTGADGRTFTNSAGKQIEAELIAVDDGSAVLKLSNGRSAKVPLASLSEEDQAYAKSWHEENKNKISERDLRLEIDKKTERLKSDRDAADKGKKDESKSDTTEVSFKCTLENLSPKTIEGISAAYTIYKRTSIRGEGGSDTMSTETSDTTEVPTLKPKGSVEFIVGPEQCVDFEKKPKKGPKESQRETVTGVVITLSIDGNEILKKSDPGDFIDRLEEEAERQEARDRGRK